MEEEDFYAVVRTFSAQAGEKMADEKITPDLVKLMSDDELSKYLTRHGDRIRLRNQLEDHETPQSKRHKLLTKLLQKLESAREKRPTSKTEISNLEDMRNPHRPFGNRNTAKMNRQIEIGWIHKSSQRSIQVRKNKGGGTRKTDISKNAKKATIVDEAIALFFPNGVSAKGPITNFDFDLWDFADRVINPDVTVAEMYEATKLPLLRFYLATSLKTGDHEVRVEDQESVASSSDEKNKSGGEASLQPENRVEDGNGDTQAMEISGLPLSDNEDDPIPGPDLDLTEDMLLVPPIGKTVSVTLHRGHLLRELINEFKDINSILDTVSIQMMMPDGQKEAAEDGGGVTRDALSEFWTTFYDQCTIGTKFKVPFLRHDFAEKEWQSVAKIILFGWKSCTYFPIQQSLPFIQLCLYEQFSASILDAFFEIIPSDEATTLKKALHDFTSVEQDDLIDALESHECKTVPKIDS